MKLVKINKSGRSYFRAKSSSDAPIYVGERGDFSNPKYANKPEILNSRQPDIFSLASRADYTQGVISTQNSLIFINDMPALINRSLRELDKFNPVLSLLACQVLWLLENDYKFKMHDTNPDWVIATSGDVAENTKFIDFEVCLSEKASAQTTKELARKKLTKLAKSINVKLTTNKWKKRSRDALFAGRSRSSEAVWSRGQSIRPLSRSQDSYPSIRPQIRYSSDEQTLNL